MEQIKVIEEKVFSYIEKHNMLAPDDKVVLGVSGGADSVCLLFVLLKLAEKMPLSLYVVHVNHGIRTEASDDAHYVEGLCKENGLPFYLIKEDVRAVALKLRFTEEEAGRKVRYDAFRRIAKEVGADKIAVAHNSNDRSETMLFNLFRGSGIKGLISIKPVRDDIIRPVLCLEREQIEEYLGRRNIFFCTDATNSGDGYTRNRIRHHILPYAQREIVNDCVGHMFQTADALGEIEDYLGIQTREAFNLCTGCLNAPKKGYIVNVPRMRQQHSVIRKRILFDILMELSPHGKDISSIHVVSLEKLFLGEGNKRLNLAFGIAARREYDNVYIETDTLEGENEVFSVQKCGLHTEILTNVVDKCRKVPKNKYTKWFDYDKIEQSPVLRTRRPGDYITIAGAGGMEAHKSLKDYFINEKIPSEKRDSIPLFADGAHIIWVVGYRISEHYKITEDTQRILQVELTDYRQGI